MKCVFSHNGINYEADLLKPIDISLALISDSKLGAWYLEPPLIEPVRMEGFVGEVSAGSSVNFRSLFFNPHAHATHTESIAHISDKNVPINEQFKKFHFIALVVSIQPTTDGQDQILYLSEEQKSEIKSFHPEAIVIRSIPNLESKKERNYSNQNPPFLAASESKWLCEHRIDHLLIDLPSVDKEKDGGELAAHKAFWNYPSENRHHASISEFIFVPSEVEDGRYLLNLTPSNFENDAAVSRPILYPILAK